MKLIKNGWRILLALALVLAAVLIHTSVYLPEKEEAEREKSFLEYSNITLRKQITENNKYASIRDQLPPALEALQASRKELYSHFPVEMKEEDQIKYVLYLEQVFGTEISFAFGEAAPIATLSDGSVLKGLTLSVNYKCDYEGFKDMITYLATDERITSVQHATVNYDQKKDKITGNVTITLYLIDAKGGEYIPPDFKEPDTGKDNIFD